MASPNASKIAIAGGVALAGLLLLRGSTPDDGRTGSTGIVESGISNPMDTVREIIVNLPEVQTLDLEPVLAKKEMNMPWGSTIRPYAGSSSNPFTITSGEYTGLIQTGDLGDYFRHETQEGRTITSNILNPQAMPKKAFEIPFVGKTGATSLSEYISTHNIYGKKINK